MDGGAPGVGVFLFMASSDLNGKPNEGLALPVDRTFIRVLEDFAANVPQSVEPASGTPDDRAREIVRAAGMKSGAMSAGLALPPGPMGLLTVIPDLIKVWQIQQQMVADVAACYGKSTQLDRRMMVYCLFRHGAAMLVRDVVARVGERVIVKRVNLQAVQQILRRVGVQVSQKAVGKSVSRWLPLIGPALIGGYSLMDTRRVGKTAVDTFRRSIEIEE